MRKLIAGAAVAAMAVGWAAGTAGADPVNAPRAQDPFTVTCGNRSYEVVTNGNGEFTPAHDINGTSMLIPVNFGPFTGTIRDADGNEVDSFTEEGTTKRHAAKNSKDLVECTFSFSEVSDGSDPEFPAGYTFTGEGTVTGRITPAR